MRQYKKRPLAGEGISWCNFKVPRSRYMNMKLVVQLNKRTIQSVMNELIEQYIDDNREELEKELKYFRNNEKDVSRET